MSHLTMSAEGAVARLVFDRPRVLNALSPSMLRDLVEACTRLEGDSAIKVVCVEGAGPCFSAGADLPAFLAELQGPEARSVADLGRRATCALADLPQITIAGVHGHCVGGGLVLAGACDIRLAAEDARFLIPELDAGIPLGWGGMETLVRLVGPSSAADWVLSCRPVGAEEALRAGLVSRVVSPDSLQSELGALSSAVAAKAAVTLRATKQQLREIRSGRFDAKRDADALLSALRDPEAQQQGMKYIAQRISKP